MHTNLLMRTELCVTKRGKQFKHLLTNYSFSSITYVYNAANLTLNINKNNKICLLELINSHKYSFIKEYL